MISISTYRRYAAQSGGFYRAGMGPRRDTPEPEHRAEPRAQDARRGAACAPARRQNAGPLASILPPNLDTGDIFLAAMLLFLYLESKDEDFLIILIVVGLSMFKSKDDKGA